VQVHVDAAHLALRRAAAVPAWQLQAAPATAATHLLNQGAAALHSALQLNPGCVQTLAATTSLHVSLLLMSKRQGQLHATDAGDGHQQQEVPGPSPQQATTTSAVPAALEHQAALHMALAAAHALKSMTAAAAPCPTAAAAGGGNEGTNGSGLAWLLLMLAYEAGECVMACLICG
jgi:hypothetical protein